MKHKTLFLTFTAALALGLSSCSKNERVTPTADAANKAADAAKNEAVKAADTAKAEAVRVAEAAKTEAARTAEVAKAQAAKTAETAKAEVAKATEAAKVEAAKTADNARTQGLIDKAQSLIADGKFLDASSVLQQLGGQTLSGDQTKLVNGLKEQIQKALAAKAAENAAGSVGNLLKK
jgi:hypothetical protein